MCLGIPAKILEITEESGTRMAVADFGGITKKICLAYLPGVGLGDYTIVHAGFAITELDEEAALESLRMFRELGMLGEELGVADSPP